MNLTQVANQAATDASNLMGISLNDSQVERVTAIVAKAMEDAVLEASSQHTSVCANCLSHDQDTAHKIQKEIERKKIGLIANLSSLR